MINQNMEKILALVKLTNNKVEGRTKFQKLVYILKNHGADFKYKFKYHYFGPYSTNLQLEIEELVDQGVLIEKGFNPYIYQIRDEMVNNINMAVLDDKKELITYLNSQDYQKLELLSTIYYLINTGIKNKEVIRNKLKILKPNLEHKIDSAFAIYQKLQNDISKPLLCKNY